MKRILKIVNLILATVAVYMGVHIFYRFVEARLDRVPVADTAQPPSTIDASRPVPPFSAYAAITRRNLFKIPDMNVPAPVRPVAIDTLKQTTLKLKLWGTVIDDDGKAYAVIEDPEKREQNLYRTGDAIQKASVKMILREKIILSVNGKDEILNMEKMVGTGLRRGRRPAVTKPGRRTVRTQKIILNRDQLAGALENVGDLMKQARIRPHFRNGKADGLLLTGIRPNSIFRKMGLRNGDIIMGANEDDIRSVDDALKLYQDLSSTASATIQIKRRGRLRKMEYTIQ